MKLRIETINGYVCLIDTHRNREFARIIPNSGSHLYRMACLFEKAEEMRDLIHRVANSDSDGLIDYHKKEAHKILDYIRDCDKKEEKCRVIILSDGTEEVEVVLDGDIHNVHPTCPLRIKKSKLIEMELLGA